MSARVSPRLTLKNVYRRACARSRASQSQKSKFRLIRFRGENRPAALAHMLLHFDSEGKRCEVVEQTEQEMAVAA